MRLSRTAHAVAAILMGLYALNFAVELIGVRTHAWSWRLGDVKEFLLVLASIAAFVTGLMTAPQAAATADPFQHKEESP